MEMQAMKLGALSLDDLMALNGTLGALAAAGQLLASAGLVPTFDLTPRWPMGLTVDRHMPAVHADSDPDTFFEPQFAAAGQTAAASPLLGVGGDGAAVAGRDGVAQPSPSPVAVAELVVAQDNTGDGGAVDHMVAVATVQAVVIDLPPPDLSGPEVAEARAAVVSPAAVPPAGATVPPAGVQVMPARWTEAEDALALEVYAEQMHLGARQDEALIVVAGRVDRPFLGVEHRFRHKLRDKRDEINAAVTKAQQAKVTVAAPAKPAAKAPVKSATTLTIPPDLPGHLASLPLARGWNRDWDMDLMTMACDGFDMAMIAGDLGTDGGAVKARFDALTGVYKDANDKTCRRFSREQVRDQLMNTAKATAAE